MIRLVLIWIVCLASKLTAQSLSVPFLSNGKYGLADATGKLIIEPKYEAASISRDHPFIMFRQNGLWGVMNQRGEVLIPCSMKESPAANAYTKAIIPSIKKVIRSPYSKENGIFHNAQLYQVNDYSAKVQYYLNPFVIPDTLISFLDAKKEEKGYNHISEPDPLFTGYVKVMTSDKKINFIDTSGHLMLREGIYDGEALNAHLFAVQNESKKIALFHLKNGALTEFLYDQLIALSAGAFIEVVLKGSGNSYNTLHSLYSAKGELLVKDNRSDFKAIGPYALVNASESGKVLDMEGKVLAEMPKARLTYEFPHQHLFYFNVSEKFGLMDVKGRVLLDPIYDWLSIQDDSTVFFSLKNKAGLLNQNLGEVFSVDSINQLSYLGEQRNYFMSSKKMNYKFLYGVIDSMGNKILPPVYSKILYHPLDKVLEVTKDSLMGVFSLNGSMILPLTKNKLSVVDGKRRVHLYTDEGPKDYILATKEMFPLSSYPTRMAKSINGVQCLVDYLQQLVVKTTYQELREVTASKFANPLFLGRSPSMGEWYDVIDANGKMILPAGYGVHKKVDNYSFTISGLIVVEYKEDVNLIKDFYHQPRYRSGVIDHKGNWVIEPDYLLIAVFGRKFITVMDFDDKEWSYFTHEGKLISKNHYWRVRDLQPGDMDQGMLLVTYPEDPKAQKSFMDKVESATSDQELEDILFANPLPTMLQGAVNLEGELVIPIEYTQIEPFQYTYSTASKKDKNGNLKSFVLHKSGKILLETNYAELSFVGLDSLLLKFKKFESDSLYGLVDLQGNVLLKPGYTDIRFLNERNSLALTSQGKIYLVMRNDFKTITQVGELPYERMTNVNTEDGFYTALENPEKSTYKFFNKEGKPYHSFEGYSISTYLYDKSLPEGIAVLQKTITSIPYFVNYITGDEFKED